MYVFSEEFGNMHVVGMMLGVLLYAVIVAHAPYTYYWSLVPVITKYKKLILKLNLLFKLVVIFLFSFLVALGVTMGRFARTNSWHIFTQPHRVLQDVFGSVSGAYELLFLVSFGIGICIINTVILTHSLRVNLISRKVTK